jgi:hypothetical protein
MKTHTYSEEMKLLVTNETVLDANGETLFEEVTCESSVSLPKLVLTDEDERTELSIAS